jgi:Tc toxin complex TcA C-terminal TcB-binding domain/Neuraminidase-like domain/Salmonella virulence plasmid 28.1kDa A protein
MPTQTKTNAATASVLESRPIRPLPITPLPPGAILLVPSSIPDPATKAKVDAKFNAALKEAIKQAIRSTDPAVEKFIDGLPLDYHSLVGLTVLSVIQKVVVPAMLSQPGLTELAGQLQQREDDTDAPTVASLLQPTVPLAQNPLFTDDVRQGKTIEALRITHLDQGLVTKLDLDKKQLEAWDDFDWENVVTEKVLTTAQRDDLLFTTQVSRLTGEQYGLVDAARKAGLQQTTDLVKWDQTNWLDLIRKTPGSIPDGVTPEAYATSLAKTVQQTFLSEYFSYRIADKTVAQNLPTTWSQTSSQLEHNPDLLQLLDPNDVDWTGIDGTQQPALAARLSEVAGVVRTYRYLGVADVLTDGTSSAAQKSTEIGRRIDALGRFLQNNSGEDLRYLNLLDGSATAGTSAGNSGHVDWTGIALADQTPVRNQLLAYQRVLHLAEDHDTATALLRAGFDSSAAVADLSYGAFRKQTGLDDASGTPVYRKAMQRAAQLTNSVQLQKDAISGFEQGRYFQGIDPSFVNDLKDLPGYADLFGNTSYCDCEDCRSIFSPAAYFTDLMYFIQKNITKPAFAGKKTHPLRLNIRRPDLWKLKLTCDNTDTLIPHLTLVIEILESYLKQTLAIQDVAQTLAGDRSAIGLPYHVPLATVREYLSDWDTDLAGVYELLNAPADALDKETLGLSDGEWNALVTSAPLDVAWIRFPSSDHSQMDAVDFLRFAAIGRDALGELQATKTAGGFTIARVKLSDDIQSEKEVVQGLSDALLDRIGRFLRLARKSGYTLTELDELLQTPRITDADLFSAKSLIGLSRFSRLAKSLVLSVESLVGVLDHIPTRPMKPDGASLGDQLGLSTFTGPAGFPVMFHHAHFNTSDPSDSKVDPNLPALLAVVGVSESDLLALFEQCPTAFPFDTNGNGLITADNISLLYGYATLARAWRIALTDLILVVDKLLPEAQGKDIRSLDLLEALQQQITLLQSLPMEIADVFSLIDPASTPVTLDAVVSAVNDFQQSGAKLFGASVLTSLPGIKPDDAATIIGQLAGAGLIAADGASYALTAAFTPSTDLGPILTPPPAPGVGAVRDALLAYHFLNLLPNLLAPVAGMDVDRTLVTFAFAQPGWDGPEIFTALATPIVDGVATQPADLQPLLKLANDLARLAELFSPMGLDTADCWFISQYPSIFGIQDIRKPRVSDLDSIRRYRKLRSGSTLTSAEIQNLFWQYQVRANGNQSIAPASPFGGVAPLVPVFQQALNAPEHAPLTPSVAPSFSSEALVPSPLNADEIALLAARNSLDATLLRSVFLSQVLPASALLGFERALQLYSLCNLLRMQGPSLPKLLARDFAGLSAAGDLLWGVLQDKYPDQTSRDKNLLPHTEALNMQRRDALCDYIIARADQLGFTSRDDLYSYFLIDAEMGGCFETSRLVAALSSLQLYVYRCLVDLEQSKQDDLSVLSLIDADDISQEWEWRKNYRVWEANRKVFLYPENYLEPELRDDKTPLFKDLENSLLQRKITHDSATDAYSDYLTGFSTLAQLKVAGVCYDENHERYWFVARSQSDPYQYYSRRYEVEAERWEPWESIDLGISAPYACPLIHLGRLYLFWVEITSADTTSFADGNSFFLGTEHQVQLHYSYRGENGKWATDQKLILIDKMLDRCVIDDTPPFLRDFPQILGFLAVNKRKTEEAVNYYRASKTYAKVIALNGDSPEKIAIHYFRKCMRTDMEIRKGSALEPVSQSQIDQMYVPLNGGKLDPQTPNPAPSFEYVRATLDLLRNNVSIVATPFYLNEETEDAYWDSSNGTKAVGILDVTDPNNPDQSDLFTLMLRHYAKAGSPSATDDMLETDVQKGGHVLTNKISTNNAHDMIPVTQKEEETVLQHWRHQHWIQLQKGKLAPRRIAVRINTTLDLYLSRILFGGGIEKFLTLGTQTGKGEADLLLHTSGSLELRFKRDPVGVLPFSGSFGDYYRELFFHIPFLVANQLNSQGKYEDAKHWYEKIFDPTAPAPQDDSYVKHRVWQYYEFRNVKVPKLKDLLTDTAAIDQYQDDPFDPFAIARLRLSAFQKAIVMKYIDNLIDWGDDLFTQDTMESVNEATMLYVLANDILGPRPVSVGPCKTADENALTYDVLGPAIKKGSEFLMYLENIHLQVGLETSVKQTLTPNANAPANELSGSLRASGLGRVSQYQVTQYLPRYSASAGSAQIGGDAVPALSGATQRPGRPDISRQYLPAFCVPANDKLLKYWDRIDDRLFKIRNCLNIHGERVTLALFQPPIDPMLLVRAKAVGLSIEDILGQQNEALPPYRFNFLVEKARQYIGTVQTFGNALLSALEKKDAEELALLRATHEQNILALQRSVKQQQIDEAQAQLAALQSQQQNVQNKIDYYNRLIQSDLNTWEVVEEDFKHTATGLRTAEALLRIQSGIVFLIAQVGSPFAMKYGGAEIGKSIESYAHWYESLAQSAEQVAASAGLEATFQRRTEEWQQQLTLATEEMKQLTKQVFAAQVRLQIAQKDLQIHEKQIDQSNEIHDFLKSKFTNIGLYTFLSGQLMRLYREAYQMTAQVARQAERAFQFERDRSDLFIQGDNWQSARSGLLAGERLLLQLNRMEKAYLETNTRDIEVNQSFSLLQINPAALQSLRQTGKCQFTLDETWFDLVYPGQYHRLLKSVRLTIPCIVGPYVNVGAKLRLEGSQVRRVPQVDPTLLVDVPLSMTRTIATSHAQNDAGVFELNFRDERYLPFEGAGAVNSQWSLELPSQIRMFDYGTMSDVIVHLSYTARQDDALAETVESNIVGQLKAYAQQNGLFRLVSLRREFPDSFYQLLNPPANQSPTTSFALESKHFPVWLSDQTLHISQPVVMWPQAVKGQTIAFATLGLTVIGAAVGNWIPDGAGSGKGTVSVSGSPIRSWNIEAAPGEIDKASLDDLLLLVRYTVL